VSDSQVFAMRLEYADVAKVLRTDTVRPRRVGEGGRTVRRRTMARELFKRSSEWLDSTNRFLGSVLCLRIVRVAPG
jgi:hypothetical protein